MEQVESFKFLGVHITNKLEWSKHTKTVVKSARQTYSPQETENIWHCSSDPQNVLQLHHQVHPDWLHHCLVWQLLGLRGKALQMVLRTAQYITGAKLPAIQDLYTRWCQRKALQFVEDSSHSSHRLFSLPVCGCTIFSF
jgi:hypothetical protein